MKWALVAMIVLAVVAGCGGSHRPDTADVRAALATSNASYLHYPERIWWGRPTPARLASVRSDGKYVVAHVILSGGPKAWRSQWALLESTHDDWQVLAVNLPHASDLACRAPAEVMRKLAGGCAHLPSSPSGSIVGPTDSRPASPNELAAIAKVGRRVVFQGRDSCVTYVAHISKVVPHYARVDYEFHKPYGKCLPTNGESIYERTTRGWRDLGDASSPFSCTFVPPGVVRSLFGECVIP